MAEEDRGSESTTSANERDTKSTPADKSADAEPPSSSPEDGSTPPNREPSHEIESQGRRRGPERSEGDGLSSRQFRLLVVGSVVIAAVFLLLIAGVSGFAEIGGSPTDDGPPDAAFTVESEATAGSVAANITHQGGDAVNPDELRIEVNGEDRGSWTDLGGEGPGIIAPGHTLLYSNVEPGDEVRLLWTGDGADPFEIGRGVIEDGD